MEYFDEQKNKQHINSNGDDFNGHGGHRIAAPVDGLEIHGNHAINENRPNDEAQNSAARC